MAMAPPGRNTGQSSGTGQQLRPSDSEGSSRSSSSRRVLASESAPGPTLSPGSSSRESESHAVPGPSPVHFPAFNLNGCATSKARYSEVPGPTVTTPGPLAPGRGLGHEGLCHGVPVPVVRSLDAQDRDRPGPGATAAVTSAVCSTAAGAAAAPAAEGPGPVHWQVPAK
jgi:hypothetical protein